MIGKGYFRMRDSSSYSGVCRLVVSDIDCTFLSTDKGIPPENCRAVEALQKAGIQFSFGTGRYWKSLRTAVKGMTLGGPQILDNGATIVDADGWKVLEAHVIPEEAVRLTWEIGHGRGFSPILGTASEYYGLDVDDASVENMRRHMEYAVPARDLPDLMSHSRECAKVAFFTSCDEESRQALCRELNRQFEARRYPVRARFTEADIVVVADAVVTKMTGVERLCRILGCSVRDVVAIGDGDNDVEMLAGCGLGIAVANATPAAKAQATHLVRSNDEAGVAQAVDMILRGELP